MENEGGKTDIEVKIAGAVTLFVYKRGFEIFELGIGYQEGGVYCTIMGTTIVIKRISTDKAGGIKESLKAQVQDDGIDMKGYDKEHSKVKGATAGASAAAALFGNGANPNEDEQGRCRTDMSGRTNELNPEYQGMKGKWSNDKSSTLWSTTMVTPGASHTLH